jgi:hypothetical protein
MGYLGCLAAFPMNGLHITFEYSRGLVSRDCCLWEDAELLGNGMGELLREGVSELDVTK